MKRSASLLLLATALVASACGGGNDGDEARPARSTTSSVDALATDTTTGHEATSSTAAAEPGSTVTTAISRPVPGPTVATTTSTTAAGPVELTVTEIATGLDTPWSLAWDSKGNLWVTERPGLLRRIGGQTITIAEVEEIGEAGLMGLEFDDQDRIFLMYTTANDNRVTRLRPDGTGETVLVSGIQRASNHDGGRIRFGPDGTLYASTGDAAQPDLAQDPGSLNGKVLAINPNTGDRRVFSLGHRNAQGLCFAPDGRFLSTEHGPNEGDEVNVLADGFNGGWPQRVGNGIRNWTPTIAPAGCTVYTADLIPQWKGSMLFVTLKDRDLRRLTFHPDGSVAGEEVLFDGQFGRLRDVKVGPDGAVYMGTSNRDGRGDPRAGDDRILRIAPKGR